MPFHILHALRMRDKTGVRYRRKGQFRARRHKASYRRIRRKSRGKRRLKFGSPAFRRKYLGHK